MDRSFETPGERGPGDVVVGERTRPSAHLALVALESMAVTVGLCGYLQFDRTARTGENVVHRRSPPSVATVLFAAADALETTMGLLSTAT